MMGSEMKKQNFGGGKIEILDFESDTHILGEKMK